MGGKTHSRARICEDGCVIMRRTDLPVTQSCAPILLQGAEPFDLYTEGDDLYAAMLASIASARSSVMLESYIFADDEIGRKFAQALETCARRGIEVRLHVDAAGSWLTSARLLERKLRDAGVQVRRFHRWSWREPLRYNRRNHRKLMVVDRVQAYLGGFNIHRQSSAAIFGEKRWRDTHLRMRGKLAEQSAGLFDAFWRGDRHWLPAEQTPASSVLLPNHTRSCRHRLRCVFDQMFGSATDRIDLTTPYFVPDIRTQRRIAVAARRGVKVRLLVPAKSDVPLARWAARASYEALLQAGVRIFEYLPRMLHAKTAVVDESWAMIGTANLDYRSFFLNYELNLVSRDPSLCERLCTQFEADLLQSREILAAAWSRRPFVQRLYEAVGWLARRWL